ncbi:hypothetical protein [Actinopolymorpha sp. B9G3]|uniref:hypothetical protein n=1 Tax=Actinopolymorpha sp. B9G3 TaxID=3158970 RepID=UPI0032D97594
MTGTARGVDRRRFLGLSAGVGLGSFVLTEQYDNKLLATLVPGAGPDVAGVEITNVAKYKAKPGFVNLDARNDLYPAWKSATEEPWMNEPDEFYSGQNVNEIFSVVSNEMKTPITHPDDFAAQQALSDAVTDVMKGKAKADDALRDANRRVENRSG